MEDPAVSARDAQLVFDREVDPSVLTVAAEPANGARHDFALEDLSCRYKIMLDAEGREYCSLANDTGRLRLDVRHGTLRDGPVKLTVLIDRLERAEAQWLTLRRLRRSVEQARLVSSPPLPADRTVRWQMALRCWDAYRCGASHREIAELLVGSGRARTEWDQASDFLRSRVRRILSFNRRMMETGWRDLLANGAMGRLRPPTRSSWAAMDSE